jgi:apolipoprotein N-acyltransferase
MVLEPVPDSGGASLSADATRPPEQHLRFSILVALTATAASGVLFFFGTGLDPVWWLTWLAPLPLLLVAPRLRPWRAFAAAGIAWSVGSLNMWQQAQAVQMPFALVLVLIVVPACLFGLVILLFRTFVRRGNLWRAALVVPSAWVVLEFLNARNSAHGTYPNLGYTQLDCLPVLQVVAVVGIWGISALLLLVPTTLACVLSGYGTRRQKTALVGLVGVVLVLVLAHGFWRLASPRDAGNPVEVCLLAADADNRMPDLFPQDDTSALTLFRRYVEEIDRLAGKGVQLIVLPEKIALITGAGVPKLDALFADAATRAGATIVVGVDRVAGTRRSNEARVYTPDRGYPDVYIKHHLLPPFEDVDQPGSKITLLFKASGTWGLEICKDMDFPDLSRQYGAEEVGLLIVPAWDFQRDGWLHSRMAIMRAVESGFTLVRVAKQGLLTVSDDRGRVLAETSSAAAPFVSLVATAPVTHNDTVYVRWGDWFAWVNVIVLLGILGSMMIVPQSRPLEQSSRAGRKEQP